jgi:hypothetical protein
VSYFYNNRKTENSEKIAREYFPIGDTTQFYDQDAASEVIIIITGPTSGSIGNLIHLIQSLSLRQLVSRIIAVIADKGIDVHK